ncbi:MAG: DegT/DnrJ/EryC1/StrS family aminotransferase [archaeon]
MGLIQVGDFRIGKEERAIINEVLDSNRLSEGRFVRQFENEWAKFVGTNYSVAFNSGSSALIAGLTALKYTRNYKMGSKVITSPLTYIATVNSIVHAGFEPVFVDVDRKTFGITPESIDALPDLKHNEDYVGILPVHLMGYPCDMDGIKDIADAHGLFVFEDSAQAHGSVYNGKRTKGKRTGSLSDLSAFSFYVAHNIQVGEMGALNTDDLEIAKMARKIKANGRVCDCFTCNRTTLCAKIDEPYDPRFTHEVLGYNFKTTEISGALGIVQLKQFADNKDIRQRNVKYLNDHLEVFSNVLQLPVHSEDISYLAYPIVVTDSHVSPARLRNALEKKGIETRPLFGSIPTQQPAYRHLKSQYEGKLPNADFVGSNGFYIGCHQYLKPKPDLDMIVDAFWKVLKDFKGV